MIRPIKLLCGGVLSALAMLLGVAGSVSAQDRPNIVLMVMDNLGWGEIGVYGGGILRGAETPRLDQLAAEGMRFSRAYCVNSVCSPSRATYFTGLIPSQHGIHCYLGGEKPDSQMGPDAYCTVEEFRCLPEILREEGYRCGLSGKWHLGDSLHPDRKRVV